MKKNNPNIKPIKRRYIYPKENNDEKVDKNVNRNYKKKYPK